MSRACALTHLALHVRDVAACVRFYQSYAGLEVVHERRDKSRVVWLAEPGRGRQQVIVLIDGGPGAPQPANDYSHLGFAVATAEEVDTIAERAAKEGRLAWPVTDEPYPVGHYCGVRDPDGRIVEFSYGQPLGPGARP